MVLIFNKDKNNKQVVGHPKDKEEAMNIINDFCNEMNYKVHHCRVLDSNNKVTYFLCLKMQIVVLAFFFWLMKNTKRSC